MKKTLLNVFSLLSVLSLSLATPIALAQTTSDTSVVNSGDNAKVTTTTTQNTNVNVTNTNNATVTQSVNASSNTGNNTANGNIGGGSVTTGSANVGAAMNVSANTNTTAIGVMTPATMNSTSVVNTGDHSNVTTKATTNTNVNVSNDNTANVVQSCGNGGVELSSLIGGGQGMGGCNANSGNNKANNNIGGGSVNTGSANLGVSMGATLNKNETAISTGILTTALTGNGLGNLSSITNTGDHATVKTTVKSDTDVNVTNQNEADVMQMVDGYTNSGHNRADNNIGNGTHILTGSANVGVGMGVDANTNNTALGGLFDMLGLNSQDIVNTGDHLNSSSTLKNDLDVNLLNVDTLLAEQSSSFHTSSGFNHSSSNIGGTANVNTGGANGGSNFTVGGNSNTTFMGSLLNLFLGMFGFI